MHVSELIAQFITSTEFDSIPETVIEQSKLAIMDWFAAYIAAPAVDPDGIKPIIEITKKCEPLRRRCTIIITGNKTDLLWAAFTNAYIGHLLDFDETTTLTRSHTTAVVFPAVLATAEERVASGEALLMGYAIGAEVAIRIGEVMHPNEIACGWHGTSVFGIFGATAGVAKLLGLSREETVAAIGLAASSSSGLAENFGTLAKPYHAAKAARDGAFVCLLAKQGVTAKPSALDGGFGYFYAYNWGKSVNYSVLRELGSPWRLETWGAINPKLNPACHGLVTSIEYGALMPQKYGFSPDDIEEIRIYSNAKVLSAMLSKTYKDTGETVRPGCWNGPPRQLEFRLPSNGLEAKFSKEYGFCKALLCGELKFEHFTDDAVQEPKVIELMKKTKVFHCPEMEQFSMSHPEVEWPYAEKMVIKLKDGRTIEEMQGYFRGGAKRPLRIADVEQKLRYCAKKAGFESKKTEKLIWYVRHLEKIGTNELIDLFCEGGANAEGAVHRF